MAAAQELSLECAARVEEVRCCCAAAVEAWEAWEARAACRAGMRIPSSLPPRPRLQAERKAAELEGRLGEASGALEGARRQAGEDRAELAAARQLCSQAQAAVQELLAANLRLHDALAQLVERQVDEGMSAAGTEDAAGGSGAAAAAAAMAWTERQQQQVQQAAPPPQQAPPQRRSGPPSRPASRAKTGSQQARSTEDEGPAVEEASGHLIRAARPNAPAARPPPRPGRCAAALTSLSRAHKAAAPPLAATHKAAAQQARPAGERRGAAEERQEEEGGAGAGAAALPSDAVVEAALQLVAQHRELHAAYQEVAAELQQLAAAGPPLGPARVQLAALRRQGELQALLAQLSERLEDGVAQLSALRRAGLL